MPTPTVAEVTRALEVRYPLATAQSWDAPGLACGDPEAAAGRVMFAVDPVAAVLDEAIEWGADLLVTHHPLLLRGVHGVAADTAKGCVVHRAIRAGIALYCAHTNADHANPGVSDAIAGSLGLRQVRPLEPGPAPAMDKYQVMVPIDAVASVLDAMAGAGAGHIGNYDRAAFISPGTGTFRPLPGANPTIGGVGRIEEVPEAVINMIAPRGARAGVVAALIAAHPYEEPAYDILEVASPPAATGIGRVGELPEPMTLRGFAELVATTLPATHHGVRVAGALDQPVGRVALCGGAGDSLLAAARSAGASVYLTSDLRHHPAGEHLEAGGPALVDVSHWAAEWMWLPQAQALLRADLSAASMQIESRVSRIVTDPWSAHIATPPDGAASRTERQEDPS
jgi:dinuclear metal center YbgI/SA1388 family protein